MAFDFTMNNISKIIALSSSLAFALQIALAFLMLRYFSPYEVGAFSVLSQIGFFWVTLSLAQTPLKLLANHGTTVIDEVRRAWFSSMYRFVLLLPVAALALWWSSLLFDNALMWVLLFSLCQFSWMIAQSLHLLTANLWALVCVRIFPPLSSLIFVSTSVLLKWDGPVLLSASLFGYAIGALWLFPIIFCSPNSSTNIGIYRSNFFYFINKSKEPAFPNSFIQNNNFNLSNCSDDRSNILRIFHALADALLATFFILVWQRLYGAQETGCLAAPLRIIGFLPAVIHMSWAQVLISHPQKTDINSIKIGLGGFVIVAIFAIIALILLKMDWLDSRWHGIIVYLLPLTLWQGSACIFAAFCHRPFESHFAKKYSWICIALSALQGFVLFLPFLKPSISMSPKDHIWLFAFTASVGLLATSYWFANLSQLQAVHRKES